MASDRLPHLAALLSLIALTAAAPARAAAPEPADRAVARRLMDDGDRKIDVKDYRGALDDYLKADAILGAPTTGIDVARTHLLLGHLVEAWRVAVSVTQIEAKPSEPEAYAHARQDAEALIAKVLPRIPTLKVNVNGVTTTAPIEVTIDDVAVPSKELRGAQKLNPGKHVIGASAHGFTTASRVVDLAEGKTSTVLLTLAPIGGSSAAGGRSPLVYAGFGVGGAGLVVGAIAGGLSLSAASAAKKVCAADGSCAASAQPDLDLSLTMANISNVGFALGFVGAAVGVVGLVISPRAGAASQPPPPVGAVLVPLSSGAAIRGWF